MTIQDFDSISSATIERGREYFENGAVTSLEEVEKGEWVATVYGSQVYDVEVELNGKKVKEADCSCPAFVQNDDCKHVAAVLYAIRERTAKPTKGAAKEKKAKEPKEPKIKTPFNELLAVVEKAADKDLRDFIRSYAGRNTDFTNRLLFFFKQLSVNKEPSEEGYKDLIRLAVKNSTDTSRYKFTDDDQLYKYLKPLVEKIKKDLAEKNYLEAVFVIKALIEELSALRDYSFSGDKAADIVLQSFAYLKAIAVSDVSFMFKDDLFAYSMQHSSTGTFEETIFETSFDQLLIVLATDNKKREQLLQSINAKIAKVTPQHAINIQYNVLKVRLEYLNTKIEILEQMNRPDEALQVIKDNIHHHEEMRVKAIENAIAEQEYNYAKKLINDRINDKTQRPGHRMHWAVWHSYLLRIAEAEKDTPSVTSLGQSLFLETEDMKFYQTARKQYTPDEWPTQRAAIISKVKSHYNSLNLLHKIYREEKMFDDLFELLKKRLNVYTLQAFSEALLPKYRTEILSMYKTELNKLAANAQNSSYNLIRDQLKHLIAIGESATAREIFSEYQVRYRNRPSMMERLAKVKFE